MSVRSRVAVIALTVASAASVVLVAAPAASAAPSAARPAAVQSKFFGIHLRLFDPDRDAAPSRRCNTYNLWYKPNSVCTNRDAGVFDAGHAGPDAGFAGKRATIEYGDAGNGAAYLALRATDGGYWVDGTVPSRGSGDFTVREIYARGFGKIVSRKLSLNVEYDGGGLFGEPHQDFYLTGNVDVETSGAAATPPLSGLFGSS